MKLGFTGTRRAFLPEVQKAAVRDFIMRHVAELEEFHHGDCMGGDEFAHGEVKEVAARLGRDLIVVHPPESSAFRAFCDSSPRGILRVEPELPYIERNHRIVDACDTLLVMPKGEGQELRSGTWATYRYGLARGLAVYVAWPDGRCERVGQPALEESAWAPGELEALIGGH